MRTSALAPLLPLILALGCDPSQVGDRDLEGVPVDQLQDDDKDDDDDADSDDKDDDDDDDADDDDDDDKDDDATGGEDDKDDDEGCTKTQGYWKNHPGAWPAGTEGEALCGTDWMDWLWTPTAEGPYGEHHTLLAHQWIAAGLNMAAGAEPSPAVADAYDQATALLETCATVPDPDEASSLATTLDEYNNGVDGTNECDEGGTSGGDDSGGDDSGDDSGTTTGGEDTGKDTESTSTSSSVPPQ
jgi:hypothetical protein